MYLLDSLLTSILYCVIHYTGADLIRQGWSRRGTNVLQEGYGTAAVLPEQGIYLAASIYRPVLQVWNCLVHASKHDILPIKIWVLSFIFQYNVLCSLRIRSLRCCPKSIPNLGKSVNPSAFQVQEIKWFWMKDMCVCKTNC